VDTEHVIDSYSHVRCSYLMLSIAIHMLGVSDLSIGILFSRLVQCQITLAQVLLVQWFLSREVCYIRQCAVCSSVQCAAVSAVRHV
jgi:hypothetical protein